MFWYSSSTIPSSNTTIRRQQRYLVACICTDSCQKAADHPQAETDRRTHTDRETKEKKNRREGWRGTWLTGSSIPEELKQWLGARNKRKSKMTSANYTRSELGELLLLLFFLLLKMTMITMMRMMKLFTQHQSWTCFYLPLILPNYTRNPINPLCWLGTRHNYNQGRRQRRAWLLRCRT